MPRDVRDGPLVINLSGERAERLARDLLSPQPGATADRLLAEIASLGGATSRVLHDWDPTTGRLTLVASGR